MEVRSVSLAERPGFHEIICGSSFLKCVTNACRSFGCIKPVKLDETVYVLRFPVAQLLGDGGAVDAV